MNILYITPSLDPNRGGVERATWLISRYLEKHNNNVFFAYHTADYELIQESHKMRFSLEWSAEETNEAFISFIKENCIDILINQNTHTPNLMSTIRYIKKEKLCKIIYCIHQAPDYLKYTKEPILKRIKTWLFTIKNKKSYRIMRDKELYENADKVVLLSKSFIDDYTRINELKNDNKIIAIPNPLSFPTNIKEEEIKEKENKVLIIARLEEKQKNIKSALRIWDIVNKSIQHNWKLTLAGHGEDEKMILDYANELQLQNFEFIGKTNDAQKHFKQASIFMMTSHYEGFGMTLTEALQNACIPIAYNTYNAVSDIIENNYNGFIIPPYNEKEYAQKIIELISDSNKRTKIQHNALKSSSKFNISDIGTLWLQLIQKLA